MPPPPPLPPLPTSPSSPTLDPHLSQAQPQQRQQQQQQQQHHHHHHQGRPQHQHQHQHQHQCPPRQTKSPLATSPPSRLPLDARGNPFPFSLTRSIQPNLSSTSIVPSVAEGKPIPVDDSTVEYRTSALRELNHHYPSRHRYAKSTGAQNSTYSEPVIVRSHYAPLPPSRPATSSRVGNAGSVAGSQAGAGRPAAAASRGLPFASKAASSGSGMLSTMVLARARKPVNGRAEDEARLPPVEAFSFKSFMANMEAQQGGGCAAGGDINADLDRIAEICARSRYSLSNQYEVHFAPHGSGSSPVPPSAAQPNDAHAHTHAHSHASGPTLQAVTSDDERNVGSSQRRRRMARRNSRAIGTLETIMSSSRSSDEERAGQRTATTAAAVTGQARGRVATRKSGESTPNLSSGGTPERQRSRPASPLPPPSSSSSPGVRTKSASSLALIDGATTKHSAPCLDCAAPRSSSNSLASEPALPQASTSQLEIRTICHHQPPSPLKGHPPPPRHLGLSVAKGAITPVGVDASPGILSILNGWIPWKSSATGQPKRLAEGSLRELLKSTDRGKSLERMD